MNIHSFQPAYFVRRIRQMRFQKLHPDAPWLSPSAVLLLDGFLRSTDVGFEWGSGRSTLWLARRVAHLESIEDNGDWHETVTQWLENAKLMDKATCRLIPCECCEVDEPPDHPYASAAGAMADESLDFSLVDGNIRAACMRAIMPKLKPGGLLILDNANRYIPNHQLGRSATVYEPRSEPRSAGWAQILDQLKEWRWINTTDGIWDTRFWIKPL
jgi:hypothetical protein